MLEHLFLIYFTLLNTKEYSSAPLGSQSVLIANHN